MSGWPRIDWRGFGRTSPPAGYYWITGSDGSGVLYDPWRSVQSRPLKVVWWRPEEDA